jgi:hypothetical protein
VSERTGKLETRADGSKVLTFSADPRLPRIESTLAEVLRRLDAPPPAPAPALPPMIASFFDSKAVADSSERAAKSAAESTVALRELRDAVTKRLEDDSAAEAKRAEDIRATIAAGFAALADAIRSITPTVNVTSAPATVNNVPIPAPVVNVEARPGESRVVAEVVVAPRPARKATIKNPDGTVSEITIKEGSA